MDTLLLKKYEQLGWNLQPVGSLDGPHEDTVSYFRDHALHDIKWSDFLRRQFDKAGIDGPVFFMRTGDSYNCSIDVNAPAIAIGATVVNLCRAISIYPEYLEVPALQLSKIVMAQAYHTPSFDEFRAWGDREDEALRKMHDEADRILDRHRDLSKEGLDHVVAAKDLHTHTAMFDTQSQDVFAGYIPNDGTNTLYLSHIG